jgi:hypothetical protein
MEKLRNGDKREHRKSRSRIIHGRRRAINKKKTISV